MRVVLVRNVPEGVRARAGQWLHGHGTIDQVEAAMASLTTAVLSSPLESDTLTAAPIAKAIGARPYSAWVSWLAPRVSNTVLVDIRAYLIGWPRVTGLVVVTHEEVLRQLVGRTAHMPELGEALVVELDL